MCGHGNSMAIMLDHRCTALGRDFISQVLKHREFWIYFQAASFGKCFLTDYRPDMFYDMCQMLRVLNAVRDYKIGIPITYQQYP